MDGPEPISMAGYGPHGNRGVGFCLLPAKFEGGGQIGKTAEILDYDPEKGLEMARLTPIRGVLRESGLEMAGWCCRRS